MRAFIFLTVSMLFTGCASVFSGYYTELEIRNAPDSLQVQTLDGVRLMTGPVTARINRDKVVPGESLYDVHVDKTRVLVTLRRGTEQVLVLKSAEGERRVAVHGKLNPWYFGLDLLCGIAPAIFDALTGNWYYYSPIDYRHL